MSKVDEKTMSDPRSVIRILLASAFALAIEIRNGNLWSNVDLAHKAVGRADTLLSELEK